MKWAAVIVAFLIILAGVVALVIIPTPKTANAPAQAQLADLITVSAPLIGATVSSPLSVSGEARGSWFFEASAPVELRDAGGSVIAQAPAQAGDNWMTGDFVPFATVLTFPAQPQGSAGTLVLKNDNPSGDPANQKELDILVVFR